MSCQENDKIWDKVLDKIHEDGLDEVVFQELDFEECYQYLLTGEVPEDYEILYYRMYKS